MARVIELVVTVVFSFCCCSDFLYGISLPDKEGYPTVDLSIDEDVKLDDTSTQNFSPKQLAIERVIFKSFSHYRCDAIITDRMRAMFTSKLWRMGKAVRHGGNTKILHTKERWKQTRWKIEFTNEELVPYNISNKKQPRYVVTSAFKRQSVLEKSLKDATKKLKEVTNQLEVVEKSHKRLSETLVDSVTKKRAPKRKAWSNCTVQHQRKKKRHLETDVKSALSFTEGEGFQPLCVELLNRDTQEIFSLPVCHHQPAADNASSTVDKVLYVKERFNVSNQCYHELSMITDLPTSYSITKAAKSLDKQCILQNTPGKGIQQSITERLSKRIRHLLQVNPSYPHTNLRVKITGDGTRVSKSVHLVVIAISLLDIDLTENPLSPRGCHTIALLNTTEAYDSLREALADIATELKYLQSITVDSRSFTLQFFFGWRLEIPSFSHWN